MSEISLTRSGPKVSLASSGRSLVAYIGVNPKVFNREYRPVVRDSVPAEQLLCPPQSVHQRKNEDDVTPGISHRLYRLQRRTALSEDVIDNGDPHPLPQPTF